MPPRPKSAAPARRATARAPKAIPARAAAVAAARALEAMKGEDVVVLDVSEVSPITEFFVIATGDNPRHVKALAEDVVASLKKERIRPRAEDGFEQGMWAVVDYGPFMVHVFHREQRSFYDLEMLWGDGTKVRWKAPVRKAKAGDADG